MDQKFLLEIKAKFPKKKNSVEKLLSHETRMCILIWLEGHISMTQQDIPLLNARWVGKILSKKIQSDNLTNFQRMDSLTVSIFLLKAIQFPERRA